MLVLIELTIQFKALGHILGVHTLMNHNETVNSLASYFLKFQVSPIIIISWLIRQLKSSNMKQPQKHSFSKNNKKQNEYTQQAFSCLVSLPKRIRQSSQFYINASTESAQQQSEENSSSSLTKSSISLSMHLSNQKSQQYSKEETFQEQSNKSIPKTDFHEQSNRSSQKQTTFLQSSGSFLSQQHNSQQNHKNTHQTQTSNEQPQLYEPAQNPINGQQKSISQQKDIPTKQKRNQQSFHQNIEKQAEKDCNQNLFQNFDKYTQKQQKTYYTEWEQVFKEQKMKELYHSYNPVHFSQNEIYLIMEAIQKASEENICGKVFIDQAYQHYYNNYGRLTQQEFEMKVVGDLLFLFRKHNDKEQKYHQQRQEFTKQQRISKKSKSKF